MFGLFRRKPNANIPTIASPTIGFLNLIGQSAAAAMAADQAALTRLFSLAVESSSEPPTCNVLFLYATIEASGSIVGSTAGLRGIIRDSRASVVVVASENTPESYIAATKDAGYGFANLVMTLERKGDLFPRFFERLFTDMRRGESMPVAWVKLAPQAPQAEHADCPATIFACELGQLAFS